MTCHYRKFHRIQIYTIVIINYLACDILLKLISFKLFKLHFCKIYCVLLLLCILSGQTSTKVILKTVLETTTGHYDDWRKGVVLFFDFQRTDKGNQVGGDGETQNRGNAHADGKLGGSNGRKHGCASVCRPGMGPLCGPIQHETHSHGKWYTG